MNRITSLDYLRGLCAFGIMIYHYMGFSGLFSFTADDFLGRIGVYGVSIFYILSGLTLFVVYYRKFHMGEFFIKRLFRIFPLLWLVMGLSILLYNTDLSWYKLIINFTGIFGLIDWANYIGTGVWSIGNELVFYLVFPFLLIPLAKMKYWPIMAGTLVFFLYGWFAFVEVSGPTLAGDWADYVNPLNQIGLFFTGIALGFYFRKIEISKYFALLLLIVGILAFTFYPAGGNPINLVTGYNRFIFTAISAVICLGFYKLDLPTFKNDPLKLLGEASYSLYLLHPIVWFSVAKIYEGDRILVVAICSIISLSISYVTFLKLEKPFIRLGNKIIESCKTLR